MTSLHLSRGVVNLSTTQTKLPHAFFLRRQIRHRRTIVIALDSMWTAEKPMDLNDHAGTRPNLKLSNIPRTLEKKRTRSRVPDWEDYQ